MNTSHCLPTPNLYLAPLARGYGDLELNQRIASLCRERGVELAGLLMGRPRLWISDAPPGVRAPAVPVRGAPVLELSLIECIDELVAA